MLPTGKILVVDDELAVRYFLDKTLTRDGYRVVAVESGEAALERLAAEEFDLVLLDLKMKGISGVEVLTALRRNWPETPAIVLTAHASLETAVEAVRQGAHDYLFKPCKTIDLRESIRTALLRRQLELQRLALLSRLDPLRDESGPEARPAPASQPAQPAPERGRFLQYRDLIVDPIRHVITLGGQLLDLSPLEFDLLAYLVSEAPRVVPAQELVREVQGYETQSWEARDTVRSHVYHIRQKVKSATGQEVIRTVRGVGYSVGD